MARQRGAVRGDVEEQAAPAVHAGLGALLVIIRGDEDQLARVVLDREPVTPLIGNAFGAFQLRTGRQQPSAVELRPAIELTGGELDEVCLQLKAQPDDALDIVDIVPVGDEVEHHRIAVGLDRTGHRQLLGEGLLRAGQEVVHLLVGGLETDLDMIQARRGELGDASLGQADAGGYQVGVVAQATCRRDQLGQILTH